MTAAAAPAAAAAGDAAGDDGRTAGNLVNPDARTIFGTCCSPADSATFSGKVRYLLWDKCAINSMATLILTWTVEQAYAYRELNNMQYVTNM